MTSLLVGIGSALGGVYAMRIVENTFERWRNFRLFARKLCIKNGYRSEMICALWDDDAIDFAIEMIRRHRS